MQHGSSSFGDNALSRCTLFDFVDTKGPIPQARWGHSAVLLHDVLYLYGGVGVQTYDDLLCFELGMLYKIQMKQLLDFHLCFTTFPQHRQNKMASGKSGLASGSSPSYVWPSRMRCGP